jgi:DNA-binding CsgD family transcriptional regulator/PAS domain-containing protein
LSIHVATEVLNQCVAAARVLVSPLAYASTAEWRHAVNAALMAAFQADQAFSIMPGAGALLLANDIDNAGVRTITSYLQGFNEAGRITLRDPVVNDWNDRRRRRGLTVYTRDLINTTIEGRVLESPFVQDALFPNRMRFWQGVYATTPGGVDALLWVSYTTRDREPFGEHAVALLGLLQPALQAGVVAAQRLDTARAAVDAFPGPFIVTDRAGREVHRSARIGRFLQLDAESPLVLERARVLAREVGAALARGASAGDGIAPAITAVRTSTRTYTLTATVMPPGVFSPGEAILVLVTPHGAPDLPGTDQLVERFALTPREAEVALKIAVGATRDAIAAELGISPHTVRAHTEKVFLKLGVNTRAAVAFVLLGG